MKFTHFRKILKKTFSLTHAAGVRLQAFTRTRFIVCVTIAPRSYFTDICRIPYRNAPFFPHPRGRRAPAGKYANSDYCMRHYRAAIILCSYLPHTVPQCTVPPSPTRQACACRQIRGLRLLYALPLVPRSYFTDICRILCRKQLCPSPTPYRRLTAFYFFI